MSAALGPSSAHAHVERPVGPEGEAARRVVDLHRRDADVEDDAVDALAAMLAGDAVEIGEAAFDQGQPTVGGRQECLAGGDCLPVAVDGDDLGAVGEDGAAIAAGAEGRRR